MDGHTEFRGAIAGRYTIAAPAASHGGSNNFYFGSDPATPANPTSLADRNSSQPRKPCSTVPFPPDPHFVDRPDILNWMRQKCDRPATRVALVGLGGIG